MSPYFEKESFFSGTIHWLVRCCHLSLYSIAAFDLMEMKLLDMHAFSDDNTIPIHCDYWVFEEFLNI
jgi:hypothetical protein